MDQVGIAETVVGQHGLDHVDREYVVTPFRQRRCYRCQEIVRRIDVDALIDNRHDQNGTRGFRAELRVVVSLWRACTGGEHQNRADAEYFGQWIHFVELCCGAAEATLIMRSMKILDSGQWASSCLKRSTAARFFPCCN